MPRYFFNVEDGASYPDKEGLELVDLGAARKVAIEMASELLDGGSDAFWDAKHWQLEVTDALGLIQFVLTFSAANAPALNIKGPLSRT
jgi:hypothetical protein